jgi:glycerophosphoryl diester phosphodiesterase
MLLMLSHPFVRQGKRPLVLGHRGVPTLHQENCLSGFRRAVELGFDGVELDVFVTRDDQVVVFHDEATERLTGHMGGGVIQRFAQEEPVPLLDQVLSEFKDKLLINIELKAFGVRPSRRHTGSLVGELIAKHRAEQRVIVTSFDPLMLHALQAANPNVHMGFGWDDDLFSGLRRVKSAAKSALLEGLRTARESFLCRTLPNLAMEALMGRLLRSRVVGMEYTLIDEDSVRKARGRQLATGAYTLFPLDVRNARSSKDDHEAVVRELIRHQVDWIETYDGERLLKLVG